MNRVTSFYSSSVGKKLLMAMTGLFLCSFLVIHLYINLFLLGGDQGRTFDVYAEFMSTYPLLRPIEIVLFLGFLLHMIIGIVLWWTNRTARPDKYAVRRAGETSTSSSRLTFVTGSVVLIFLVIHVNTFFVSSRFFPDGRTMYEMVATAFQNPLYDLFYLAALFFLGYHLKHGFQSAFQTFGIRFPRYQKLIDALALLFWLVIPLAFAAMPVYFYFSH